MRTTAIERRETRRQVLALLLALLLAFTMLPLAALAQTQVAYGDDGGASESIAITETTTISEGGDYALSPTLANATITIATSDPVTIAGNGIGDGTPSGPTSIANANISITGAIAGVDLTLEDVFINGPVGGKSVLDFQGANNTLRFVGTSDLETTQALALIHVPSSAELTILGAGTAYMYKSANGAGIGGNADEAGGAITVDGPSLFIKGTKMGALIGGGGYGVGIPGDITIESGELNLIGNARGAILGTGASSTGTPGNVYIKGGLVNFNIDFSGSAIGNGNNSPVGGKAYITGGSVRAYVDTNAVSSWGSSGVTAAGVNPAAITAATLDSDETATQMLAFDTGILAQSAEDFEVFVDDQLYYSGGLHKYWFVQANRDKDLGEQITITTTPSNWIIDPDPDPNLYFFLTGDDHVLKVNGETFDCVFDEETSTFTVTEAPAFTIDTSWYNTESESFVLFTKAQLAGLAAIVNGTTEGIAQDDFFGKTITLGADVALDENGKYSSGTGRFGSQDWPMEAPYYTVSDDAFIWTPIGTGVATANDIFTEANYFRGTFDGADYTISGLYTSHDSTVQGLFGNVMDGTIKNLTIEGCVVGRIVVGAAVAHLVSGTVSNITNRAIVYADGGQKAGSGLENGISRGGAVGGVVGSAGSVGDAGFSIQNCTNYGTIICTNSAQGGRTGGILGLVDKASYVGAVTECLNYGDVTGYQYSGGVVGLIYATQAPVSKCANYGTIMVNTSGQSRCGGIVADCYSDIISCYNRGNYAGKLLKGDKISHLGGIVADTHAPARVVNSYNTGHLVRLGTAQQNTTSSVGRIAGYGGIGHTTATPNLINCYFLAIDSDEQEFADCDASLGGQGWLPLDASKTDDELKSSAFLQALNTSTDPLIEQDAFRLDTDGINDGYPILAFQGGATETVGAPGSGDLNGDGAVTVNEALSAARAVVSGAATAGLSDIQVAVLDIDGDGRLTMADVVRVLRKAVGL